MTNLPVCFHILVSCHEGRTWFFEMNYSGFPAGTVLFPGLRLANIDNMPNVFGPDAPCDNQIAVTTWCGKKNQFICQVQGVRYSDRNLDEIKDDLVGWEFKHEIVKEELTGPGDILGS